MSCSSPPPLEHHHDAGRTRAPALDLLDEYWFFSNTLVTNNSAKKKPPHLPRSPSTSTSTGTGTGEKASASAGPPSKLGGRRLLRTPSLPMSRVGMTMELPLPNNKDDDDDLVHQDGAGAAASASGSGSANRQPQRRQLHVVAADEVDDDDLNWSSIYEGVLRTRMAEGGGRSALRRAPSMPVPSSATATDHPHHHDGDGGRRQTKSTPSMPRLLRHSHSTASKHQAEQRMPSAVARCSKKQTSGFQLQDKKWKSSSDLESIEVQGFRDLGFVFEQEELRESLADVLPGLKQQTKTKSQSSSTSPRRPYLSEAWQQVRRPALVRVQSAAEMKDQLRMWAQAVACNVRQEC